jgi:hypothetical protein
MRIGIEGINHQPAFYHQCFPWALDRTFLWGFWSVRSMLVSLMASALDAIREDAAMRG